MTLRKNIDDKEILELWLSNKEKALEILYQKYVQGIYATACRYLGNTMDAEEVVSDAFMKAFNNLATFEYTIPSCIWYWIKKITVNECLMKLRKKSIYFHELEINDLQENVALDNLALDILNVKEINKHIANLPDGYRTIFNLYELEGYKHNEIATLLNISEQTSRSQLHKAKKYLQKKLSQKK